MKNLASLHDGGFQYDLMTIIEWLFNYFLGHPGRICRTQNS